MAKKKRSVRTGRTRFHLSRGGETALAGTGVVILLVLGIALVFWAKTAFFPASPEELARLAAQAKQESATVERLERSGAILKWAQGVEVVIVDRGKWLAEPEEVRRQAAKSLARKIGLKLVLLDDPSGKRVAWVHEGEGYKEPVVPAKKPL